LDPSWLELADEIVASAKPEAHSEIPQLWNMRGNSRIQLQDGKLVDIETGVNMHAIYGGVQFGLDRFELAQRHALPPGAPAGVSMSSLQQAGLQNMQLGPSGRPMFMPQRFQLTQRGETPQGVDLNLDKFSLSAPDRFASSLPPCSAGFDSMEARVTLGKAFLRDMRNESFVNLEDKDRQLIKDLFNPVMADRTEEGDSFIPPDPNKEYIGKVRSLVSEELSLRGRRKAHFYSKNFLSGNAGAEFPRSWTSRYQGPEAAAKAVALKSGLIAVEMDTAFKLTFVRDVLPTVAPEFNRATEDGVVFRIYKIGSLEVRTTQEPSGPETVGAAFSHRTPTWDMKSGSKGKDAFEGEKLMKCLLYVEAVHCEPEKKHWASKQLDFCHYYAVLETDASNTILTERLEDGSTTWVVNPSNLQDRNSLAKLLFNTECKEGASVRDLKIAQISFNVPSPEVTASNRKNYARAVVAAVCQKPMRKSRRGRRFASILHGRENSKE